MVIRGRQWQWIDGGRGKVPLLLLTGGSQVAEAWFDVLPTFERRFRVIAPSYPPVDTVDEVVHGICRILDHEGVRRAHVVGTSLGGFIAQALALRCPGRVDRLVLAETTVPSSRYVRRVRWLRRLARWVPTWALRAVARRRYERSVSSASRRRQAFWAAYFDHYFSQHWNPRMTDSQARLIEDFFAHYAGPVRRLRRRSRGILLIEAGADHVIPAPLREAIRRTFPAAPTRRLEGAEHAADLAHPRLWTSAVLDFLDAGLAPRRPAPRATPAE